MSTYAALIGALNTYLYTYVLVALLIAAGLYFTIRTKFAQFRLFGNAIKILTEKAEGEGAVSSFHALMISTASRVGTGNIAGVSTAICLGGAGSVFWMWIIAIVGAVSAFIESTLAQIYKKRDADGGSYGGPAYYIRSGLGWHWLAAVFAIFLIMTYMGGFNMVAAFNVNSAFATFDFYHETYTPLVISIALASLMGICIFGSGKRLSAITAALVPFMAIAYIIFALIVVVMHADLLPGVFVTIFREAFDCSAIFGGFAGSCAMYGIKRGLYSNEAGVGSAPNAAAAASVSHPVKQGLVQMLSVYIDTLVVCSATAFLLLVSGVAPSEELKGVPYAQAALAYNFGAAGPWFVTTALFLFGFTTFLGNYFYAEQNFKYLCKGAPKPWMMRAFRGLACLIIFFGAQLEFSVAWDTADVLMGLMALINLPVILCLSRPAIECLRDYTRQHRVGDDPVFLARKIDLPHKTDFWR
jgi:AGCS family alanine or glycine:cation symporter